jgi:hypothetical protein
MVLHIVDEAIKNLNLDLAPSCNAPSGFATVANHTVFNLGH